MKDLFTRMLECCRDVVGEEGETTVPERRPSAFQPQKSTNILNTMFHARNVRGTTRDLLCEIGRGVPAVLSDHDSLQMFLGEESA